MENLLALFGRFHPLIVHLPIGFILFGLLLQLYDRRQGEFARLIPIVYAWAGIAAILACISGYLLYTKEGYAFDTVKIHLWTGLVTAGFCFLMYLRSKPEYLGKLNKAPMALLGGVFFILISATGHLGGEITHGEGYLTEPLPEGLKSLLGLAPKGHREIVLQEDTYVQVAFYEGLIAPILQNRCVSCHSAKRSKGGLELQDRDGILKGGEDGKVVVPHKPGESALYGRMVLPIDDEDHMPPREKEQPSKEEVALLEAWINLGCPFEGSLGELGIERALLEPFFPPRHEADYPDAEVALAPADSVARIKETGIHVGQIAGETHFIKVSCINRPEFGDNDMAKLLPIADQVAILDLGGTQVTDSLVPKLRQFRNLTVLKLDHTALTGATLNHLSELAHLKTIDLSGSQFEDMYLPVFEPFKALKKVTLFNTHVTGTGVDYLDHGRILVEYGNYGLPPLKSDSIVY